MKPYHSSPFMAFKLSDYDIEAKNHILVVYLLMIMGCFTGVLWFIGALWAMIKIHDAQGSLFEDHYVNIVSVFWWGLGWMLIGTLLTIIWIGYIVIICTWLWAAWRIFRGFFLITSNRPYHLSALY